MKRKYIHYLAAVIGGLTLTACLEDVTNHAEGTLSPVVAIKHVRELYNGDDITLKREMLMGAHLISGIVISDAASKNIEGNSIVLQNMNKETLRGITVVLNENTASNYKIGDSITVDVTDGVLTRKSGTMVITGLAGNDVTKVSSNGKVFVQSITMGNLYTNFASYESTLVQLNSSNTVPASSAGSPLVGDRLIDDGTGASIKLTTLPTAVFANKKAPLTASYVGIPTYYNSTKNTSIGADLQLRLRSESDIVNPVGAKYPSFPETFETPPAATKGSYNMTQIDNNVNLSTGNWKLYQAILAGTFGSDRFNPTGAQGIRIQQNLTESGYVQMNFDVPNGASLVTFSYGSYGSDASSTFQLEYSQDGGTTWTMIGAPITDAASAPKLASFPINIQGPVRFRINKLGLGTTDNINIFNGRLSIDDITIYESVE